MLQLKFRGISLWILLLLAILVLSIFAGTFFSLVKMSKMVSNAQRMEQVVVETIKRPPTPDLHQFSQLLNRSGFDVLKKEHHHEIKLGEMELSRENWIQGHESWVLLPDSYDKTLMSVLLRICEYFVDSGWTIQIEGSSQGYTIGFWGLIPETGHRVLTYFWEIELLNPKNYPLYGQVSPVIAGHKGKMAIIIDDWGYATSAIDPLIAFPLPLTIAVLPHLPVSREVSELAYNAGHAVILHQPMEALDGSLDLGPGGIKVDMDKREAIKVIRDNLASLPVVSGMNNHMGSRVTEDPATMALVLEVLKEQGMFFVDSHTSPKSIAPAVAKQLQIPYSINNLFLDNENDVEKIKEQVRKGIELAKRQGQTVVIGHVRPDTATALWQMLPELIDSGIEFVPITHLLQ